MRCVSSVLVAVLVVAAPHLAEAATKEVRIDLRLRPKIKVTSTERVLIGPVTLEPRADAPTTSADLAATREFRQHLRQLLRRETDLTIVEYDGTIAPPSDLPSEATAMAEFWRQVGAETDAQLIVTASLDVRVLDREGYTTEEYVSPTDGKTYFRQVLVEETGFSYDILLTVLSGETGEVVHQEQISDFKERSDRKLQEYQDMFDDLYTLENRLLGVFVPRSVVAKRVIYTN
jgi:hypothetical protein